MRKGLGTIFLGLTLCAGFAQEKQNDIHLDEVVVTANKFKNKQSEATASVHVITREQIAEQKASNITELFNQIPNLHVRETYGNSGSILSYSMRGGSSKDVVIMVNGLPVGDDSQINNYYDLNFIAPEAVERIEIINGGASTLYGANASAGVINIILREQVGTTLSAKVEAGKWGTHEETWALGTTSKNGDLSARVALTNFGAKGFSAANDKTGTGNFDLDPARKQNVNLNLGYNASEALSFQLNGLYNRHKYDFDGGAYFDSKNKQLNKQIGGQLLAKYALASSTIQLKTSYNNYDRENKNPYGAGPDYLNSEFQSANFNADLFADFSILENSKLVGGLYHKNANANEDGLNYSTYNYENKIHKDSATYKVTDPYLALQINDIKYLTLDIGGRYNTHSNYDNKFVYHGALQVKVPFQNDKSYVSIGNSYNTSYNTPSLYQLYSQFGKQDLNPESAKSYDATFEINVLDKVKYTATYFQRKEQDLIGFSNTTFKYDNLDGESKAHGFENSLHIQPIDAVGLKTFYAFSKRDKQADFFRQPKNEFGAVLTARSKEYGAGFTADYRRADKRDMPLYNVTTQKVDIFTLDAYNSLNITVNKDLLKKQLNVFAAFRNTLNQELTDNLGYNSEGFNVRAGLEFNFNK